jgi:sorbitol-specific phosphotransferase system component IIBC
MLVHRDDYGWMGRCQEVAIEVWSGPGGPEVVRQRYALQREGAQALSPRQIIQLTVIHDAAIRPVDNETRKAIEEGVKSLSPFMKASVTVMPSSGLKAAIVRGIIASLTLVSGAKYPTKVVASLEEAFMFLAPFLDAPATVAEVRGLFAQAE